MSDARLGLCVRLDKDFGRFFISTPNLLGIRQIFGTLDLS